MKSIAGSWKTGVRGAEAGTFVPAQPFVDSKLDRSTPVLERPSSQMSSLMVDQAQANGTPTSPHTAPSESGRLTDAAFTRRLHAP